MTRLVIAALATVAATGLAQAQGLNVRNPANTLTVFAQAAQPGNRAIAVEAAIGAAANTIVAPRPGNFITALPPGNGGNANNGPANNGPANNGNAVANAGPISQLVATPPAAANGADNAVAPRIATPPGNGGNANNGPANGGIGLANNANPPVTIQALPPGNGGNANGGLANGGNGLPPVAQITVPPGNGGLGNGGLGNGLGGVPLGNDLGPQNLGPQNLGPQVVTPAAPAPAPQLAQPAPIAPLAPEIAPQLAVPSAPATPAPQIAETPATGERLLPWQVQFRLGQMGFSDIRFLDQNQTTYMVSATIGATYTLSIDAYKGEILAYHATGYAQPAQNYGYGAQTYGHQAYPAPAQYGYQAPANGYYAQQAYTPPQDQGHWYNPATTSGYQTYGGAAPAYDPNCPPGTTARYGW